MTPELIQSSAAADRLLQQLANIDLIAVDTEFFRETSYYPELALVQIATDSIVACIDPLAFDAKPVLQTILLNPSISKIFHSCSQDMEVLYYFLGQAPVNVYDTQLANALLTDHQQIGYAALVENELGVQLDKSQTRTNWLQRPLTEKQIQYAGDDVYYLYQLQHKLDTKLRESNRHAWFEEDSLKLCNSDKDFQVDTEKLWRRIKGSTQLERRKLAIAQAIAVWREQLAMQKDKTRRKILADNIILDLAQDPPENINELRPFIDSRQRINDSEKQDLLQVIAAARKLPQEKWPDNHFSLLDSNQKSLLKRLQQITSKKAAELGISGAVLSSKKELEQLVLCCDSPQKNPPETLAIMQGWRFQCLGKQLLETVKNEK